jgi:biopolymer transport protein TolQ
LRVFRKSRSLEAALTSSREYGSSNLRRLADTGFNELKEYDSTTKSGLSESEIREGVLLTLERAVSQEFVDLERYLVFLAMVSTISPFLGLLGTVWGIMHAFMDIGTYGTANLSVVGPGIAEALITTIAGLGAAIPAVMGYNYFVSKVKAMGQEMENFASEFLSMLIKRGVM